MQYAINNKFKILHSVWYARIVRRSVSLLIRTPVKKGILKLINLNVPVFNEKGCIIVMCRTPWKRLLVQWCLKENFGLIIARAQYSGKRHMIHRRGVGVSELRDLLKHLRLGGRIIAIADVVNNLNDCSFNFLDKQHNFSLFVERLATLAQVPILVMIPKLSNNTFDFICGPKFLTDGINAKDGIITRQVISFLEKEIKTNPAIWSNYVN